jgi:hypothetical protein
MTEKREERPGDEPQKLPGPFQEMIETGAIERLPDTPPDESLYNLNIKALEFLRKDQHKPASKPPASGQD